MKSWNIKHKFESDFVDFMESMIKKYPDEVFSIQGIADHNLDIVDFSKKFFGKSSNVANVSVDGNANVVERNITQYNFEHGKALMKLNSLNLLYKYCIKFFDKESADRVCEKVINGDLFINDFTNFAMPYCYSFDLTPMLIDGLSFFNGNMKIKAPKRAESFINLFIQATAYISNQIMGAGAYPNFFPILDWFYRNEYGEHYIENFKTDSEFAKKITNQFQNVIYSLNWPFRGGQSPFTNLSVLDRGFLDKLFKDYIFPDFTPINVETTLALSKLFFEYYTKINCKDGIFTFPVMTIALSLDEDRELLDKETAVWASEANAEKGLANIFQDVPSRFSSCCRMLSDLDTMNEVSGDGYQNSFGVSGVSIGSLRVAGINLPRMAIEKLNTKRIDLLHEHLDDIYKILYVQRKLIEIRIDGGFLPLYTHGWIYADKQYSTIGFVGAYEYVKNLGLDIKTKDGKDELLCVLNDIESFITTKQKELHEKGEYFKFNVEQIPAESMAVRLAELDTLLGYNPEGYKLYSNQYIPLIEETNIIDRFELQGYFDKKTTGGAILHVNVNDERPLSAKQLYAVMKMARDTGTVYFALNYAFSQSSKGLISVGIHEVCPVNGDPIVKKYTRVVGFLTPTESWNSVRKNFEFPERKFYSNEGLKK